LTHILRECAAQSAGLGKAQTIKVHLALGATPGLLGNTPLRISWSLAVMPNAPIF
jgi:hypothetical protein